VKALQWFYLAGLDFSPGFGYTPIDEGVGKMKFIRNIKDYLVILCGTFILAFGLYNIHSRTAITEGGVLGAILLIEHWFKISPSISGLVLDLSCYAIGFRYLGWSFARYSLAASLGFSACYRLMEYIGPVMPDLSPYPLAAAILGGMFVGMGVGMCVRIGGAAGGDDALAMTISKVTGLDISHSYLFTDIVVLALSLSYIPFKRILYSLVTVTISSYLIGFIQKLGKKE